MKAKIILYLFIFTAVILMFQIFNSNKVLKFGEARLRKEMALTEKLKDSLEEMVHLLEDTTYFSLEGNPDALAYFDDSPIENVAQQVTDALYEYNIKKGGNDLIPYEGMEGTFLINKVMVVNQKWVLADFSDGRYWGELLLHYRLSADGSVTFTLKDHFLYNTID